MLGFRPKLCFIVRRTTDHQLNNLVCKMWSFGLRSNISVSLFVELVFPAPSRVMSRRHSVRNILSGSPGKWISCQKDLITLTFPASLMAAMILVWSGSCIAPTVDITTSTCLVAFTRLSWSYKSPCGRACQSSITTVRFMIRLGKFRWPCLTDNLWILSTCI